MIKLRRSLMFSTIDRYVTMAINLLTMAVVARLLSPSEVGVFMVGSAVLMIIEAFREFGTSVYLIQERELTPHSIRAVFTVSLILSTLFAGIVMLTAPMIATFYDQPGLEPVLRITAIAFLVSPFASPIIALMRREMAFNTVAIINITGAFASSCVIVSLALLGFSYLSLAWAALVAAAVSTAVTLWFRPHFWIFRPTLRGWRGVLSFGGFSSATALINIIFQQLPQIIIGRLLSFDAVGLYSRATLLCQIPERAILSAIQPVVLPALSAETRSGRDVKRPYLHALALNSAVYWPFLLCLALLAHPIVFIVLGEQWMAVAPLVQIIALASLPMFAAFMTYPILIAMGRVKDTLISSLISLPPSIALVFFAAQHGLEAVAASMFITAPLQVYVALHFVRRQVSFSWRELGAETWRSAVAALCSAVTPGAVIAASGFQFDVSVIAMVIGFIGAGVGWIIGLSITRHPLLDELRILREVLREAAAAIRGPLIARFKKADTA